MTKTFTEWLNEKEDYLDEAVSDAEVANFTKGMNVKDLEAFLTGHFNRTTSHPLAWTMVTKNAKSGAVALFNQKNSGLKNMNSADAKLIDKLVRAGMAKFVKITDPVLQDKHGTDWNSSLELTSKGAGLLTALQKKK